MFLHGISVGHVMAAVLAEQLPPRPQAGSSPDESMREGEALARPCFPMAKPSSCARPPPGGRSAKRTQGGQSDE